MSTPLQAAIAAETERQDAQDTTRVFPQTTGRTGSAPPRPVPAPSPPPATPVTGGGAEPSIDALVNAAVRSASKRTQALGAKLGELAGVVRQRLREERDAAEKAEQAKAVRDAATAEVTRLEAQLAEARAKLGRKSRTAREPKEARPLSDAQRNQLAKMRAAQHNEKPCAKGCGFVAKTASGKSAHERHCPGGAK